VHPPLEASFLNNEHPFLLELLPLANKYLVSWFNSLSLSKESLKKYQRGLATIKPSSKSASNPAVIATGGLNVCLGMAYTLNFVFLGISEPNLGSNWKASFEPSSSKNSVILAKWCFNLLSEWTKTK